MAIGIGAGLAGPLFSGGGGGGGGGGGLMKFIIVVFKNYCAHALHAPITAGPLQKSFLRP